jgi:hypothetical protein
MAGYASKSFDKPDETRAFQNGRVDVVQLTTHTVARGTMEKGWRWSTSVKPIVGTESCQGHHVGYAASGSMHVVLDEGSELDINPGDVYEIQPGHDAWVTSEEPFVGLEFQSKTAAEFAKPG